MNRSPQGIRSIFAGVVALVLFGIGLIAPLTPSHGVPLPKDLVVFLLGPVLILVAAVFYAHSGLAKTMLAIELILILFAAFKLLNPMYGYA